MSGYCIYFMEQKLPVPLVCATFSMLDLHFLNCGNISRKHSILNVPPISIFLYLGPWETYNDLYFLLKCVVWWIISAERGYGVIKF